MVWTYSPTGCTSWRRELIRIVRSCGYIFFFFFSNPPPPEIYTLPLHDALPISATAPPPVGSDEGGRGRGVPRAALDRVQGRGRRAGPVVQSHGGAPPRDRPAQGAVLLDGLARAPLAPERDAGVRAADRGAGGRAPHRQAGAPHIDHAPEHRAAPPAGERGARPLAGERGPPVPDRKSVV